MSRVELISEMVTSRRCQSGRIVSAVPQASRRQSLDFWMQKENLRNGTDSSDECYREMMLFTLP